MSVQTKVRGPRGAMAYGVPGDIFDNSPLRAHPYTLQADAVVGTYVSGQGLIISPREYALRGTDASLAVLAGTPVTCATFGHFIVALTATASASDIDAWAISTAYAVGDYVKVTGTPTLYYRCTVAHTSAASGTIDLTKFVEVTDEEAIGAAAVAAFKSALPTVGATVKQTSGVINTTGTDITGSKFIVVPDGDDVTTTFASSTATALGLAVIELNG